MPQNSNFRLPHGHRFFAKNGSYGYGAKSRWRHPTVHLGANGVPLGPRNGSKLLKNYHASKFEFSTIPRSTIFRKKWKLRLWRQITVGTPYGPSWGQWGPIGSKKWVKAIKNTMPQTSNFRLPRGHRFSQKMENTVMAPNHGGDPLGSILGSMGTHWVQKMGHNRKK